MDDVVGCTEAKKQLRPIVNNFRNGSHDLRLSENPLALVFYGPEGTGKRTMAKSVAAEATATFVEVEASDIQSVVNSVRLRSLFGSVVLFVRNADGHRRSRDQDDVEHSKSAFTPSSKFLGRRRSGRKSGSKYESSNLSQLLLNDALKPSIASWILPSSPVMIILSSASELSTANGKFFQQIGFHAPTMSERQQLFFLKLKEVGVLAERAEKLAASAAVRAFGLNGAEISRVCFRAAVKAGDNAVGQELLDTVLDEEDLPVKDFQKEMTAVHEVSIRGGNWISNMTSIYGQSQASHAVVAWMMEDGLAVDKITILPKGGALGSTQFKKRKVFTKENVFAM
jgi:cell division protease FtsH